MWPFSKPPSWLGVDIGAYGVKVVQLEKKKKRSHLFTFGYANARLADGVKEAEAGLLDVQKTAELLKKICAKAKVTTKQTLAALPLSSVLTSVISIPRLDKKEADMFVRREAEKFSPLPIDEMQIEWTAIKRAKPASGEVVAEQSQEVLLTAASKKTIRAYSEICKQAGLQLISLEAETYALISALVGKDLSSLIIIDIGASQTDFFLIESGVPVLTHSLALGGRTFTELISRTLGVDLSQAEQIKMDLGARPLGERNASGFFQIFESAVSPIVDGINYLLDLSLKQRATAEKPEKFILTGGGALLPNLDAHLARLFSTKVYLADPWARVIYDEGLKPLLDSLGPRLAVALGLVIKKIES